MNKRQQNIVNSYNCSVATKLSDVYGSYSSKKSSAYENCLQIMKDNDGHDMKILGASSSMFSCACLIDNDTKLMYFTKSGQEIIELEVK